MKKELIILGSGPEFMACPFDKETWIIGKLLMLKDKDNNPFNLKRIDRIYSMDEIETMLTVRRGMFTTEQFVDAINKTGVPYISTKTREDIPLSEAFPIMEIIDKFKLPYFENTITYMIIQAIDEGFTDIHLYGIAQMGAHEYTRERRCVEYWLGIAAGMGIAINIMTPSALLKGDSPYMYGYTKTFDQLKKDKHE